MYAFSWNIPETYSRVHTSVRHKRSRVAKALAVHRHFYGAGKIATLCFYMVGGNPVPSCLPKPPHSPRTFSGATLARRIPLCAQRHRIYTTLYARHRYIDEPSRLPSVAVSTEVRNNVSLADVWNREWIRKDRGGERSRGRTLRFADNAARELAILGDIRAMISTVTLVRLLAWLAMRLMQISLIGSARKRCEISRIMYFLRKFV